LVIGGNGVEATGLRTGAGTDALGDPGGTIRPLQAESNAAETRTMDHFDTLSAPIMPGS